ncbi:MAG: bifunctional UDP-N-acetylglucosamine diphosphorylase/glucosamine-1-phosphate N-acetyltransferase GlmU [Oscillospiraceae bacterium]|nr:bifunctional UDP-N-acetylglucosamine diphosphorylase/glucosamine-1-phosphate N-acetyltransferase GlmU [Oscillospiraceae bacterium]
MDRECAIILAAGEGKRMGSNLPKVLCEVLFEPMLEWVIRACKSAEMSDLCTVLGYKAEVVKEFIGNRTKTAIQTERKGTAHAVMCARSFLENHINDNVLICCADSPFLDSETIKDALYKHKKTKAAVTVITANLCNPTGYGRIVRTDGKISAIVEEKDATKSELNIKEINSGAYWFCVKDLIDILEQIKPKNSQNEYYLTDAISLLLAKGKMASTHMSDNPIVAMGANDRAGLLRLNQVYNKFLIEKFMQSGVEFLSIDGILISPTVSIERGTRILPGTILCGNTKIGSGCVIGPNSLIEDSVIGNNCKINATQVYKSEICDDVLIGPFCHIRPNSKIHHHVKIGDFVEVKNSELGAGTSVSHLTYVGDSDVGKNVNFGCGVVTINYDGVNKNRCKIGNGAFIGCNTNLVAPVKIGENSYTAAGSTITKNVPPNALGIERTKQSNIAGFAKRKLKNRKLKVKD